MARLTVYSSDTCPNCDQLKKALGIKNIEFQEINITQNPTEAEVLREKGMRRLPVINAGDEWMTGFTPENFKKILQSNTTTA